MQFDLDAIAEQLFVDAAIRAQIIGDYGIVDAPGNARALRDVLFDLVRRDSVDRPVNASRSNTEVFRAAVLALGSNMRPWSTFHHNEPMLKALLKEYDPEQASAFLDVHPDPVAAIKAYLPGITGRRDARAMITWARRLSGGHNYYDGILELANAMRQEYWHTFNGDLPDTHLLLALVGYLAYPPTTWPGTQALGPQMQDCKLPGMGYALGSEFLRTLGWNGFKPDTHITRLFRIWFEEHGEVQEDVMRLQTLIGTKAAPLTNYLRCSLLGLAAVPPGVPPSCVDNLVWMLGVYVEHGTKESTRSYLRK